MKKIHYRVQSGDSLPSIARRHNIPEDVLSRMNGISDLNPVRPGLELQIPQESQSTQCALTQSRTYRVRADDNSLAKIAQRNNVTEEALRQANGLSGSSKVPPIGVELQIPPASGPGTAKGHQATNEAKGKFAPFQKKADEQASSPKKEGKGGQQIRKETGSPVLSDSQTSSSESVLPSEDVLPVVEIKIVHEGHRVVPLKWALPEYRPAVRCLIRVYKPRDTQPKGQKGNEPKGQKGNEPITVELTNLDGHLRFHDPPSSPQPETPSFHEPQSPPTETRKMTLPANHGWAEFSLSGELPSKKPGDAQIKVHLGHAKGPELQLHDSGRPNDKKKYTNFTVFWFDEVSLNSYPGYAYHCMEVPGEGGKTVLWVHTACESKDDTEGRAGITHEASVSLKPSGVSCNTWQINRLYVGFIQNTTSSFREETYGRPEIVSWEKDAPIEVRSAEMAEKIIRTFREDQQRNDTTDKLKYIVKKTETENEKKEREKEEKEQKDIPPFYARPARALFNNVYGMKANTISDDSLKPLLECDGGGTAKTEDSPGSYKKAIAVDYIYKRPGSTGPGVKVATVRYYPTRIRIRMSFLVWVAVIKIREDQFVRLNGLLDPRDSPVVDLNPERFCVLQQRSWALDYDSARAGNTVQRATVGNAAAPTMPAIEKPYIIDLSHDEARWTEARIGKVLLSRK